MSYGDNPAGEQAYDTGDTSGVVPQYLGQPGYGDWGSSPPAYRAWGLAALICGVLFNLVLGLPSAIAGRRYSAEVQALWASGDVQGAVRASRKARGWLIAATVFDLLGVILLVVTITASGSDYNNPSAVAASLKSQVQHRLRDKSGPDYLPGVTVTSAVCTPARTNTDHCVIKLSNGQSVPLTATISGNGTGYTAK